VSLDKRNGEAISLIKTKLGVSKGIMILTGALRRSKSQSP